MLAAAVAQLTQAARRLQVGAATLQNGISTLERGQRALALGIDRLATGDAALTAGLASLSSGTATLGARLGALQSGAGSLASGLASEQQQAGQLTCALRSGQRSAGNTATSSPRSSPALTTLAHSPGFFSSGYLVLAALQGTAGAQRAGVDFTVNVAKNGQSARILIVPRSIHGISDDGGAAPPARDRRPLTGCGDRRAGRARRPGRGVA